MAFKRRNGWLLLAHPQFEDQYAKLQNEVRKIIIKHPADFHTHPKVKLFAALEKLTFEVIPENPARESFVIGNTLGPENRSWRRAKFGQQYRLFFRFDSNAKIIIFGWVNDENTLRAYQSKTDAYVVFKKKIAAGQPPTDWDELLETSGPISPN